ncbi:protein trachealess isoform X3 [Folsomia candida]|uniref:protein trachealess isoform X3 n=1 Tax=Folsomia candida TaxID=158441 RepID=UPI0016055AD8|nr:protein trachealess isoform X3 [Folsomia candida]
MMGPGDGYSGHHSHHPSHPMPMDLHVPQAAFPYYRYRNEAFCWPERKPGVDDMASQGMLNQRIQNNYDQRFQPTSIAMPKEKSRDAARSRRGKENYEFYELAKLLPLPAAITSQLDKASIIRLTISFLRLKDFSAQGEPPWQKDNPNLAKKANGRPRSSGNITLDLFEQHQGTHILQSLDGFAFGLAADGRFLYISETVSIYLGLSQVEMTGSSIFDYIHQQDHAELAEQLNLGLSTGPGANIPSPSESEDGSSHSTTNNPDVNSVMTLSSANYKGLDRAFCIRMKSTLTKRGCHFKSSGYRFQVVLVLSRLRPQYSFSHSRKSPPPLLGMVALAIALPPPSVHEIRLECDMFVTRVTFDFRIVHCEPRVSELLDYSSEELTGRNLYAICHAEDVSKLRKCHVDLLGKGQVMSQYFRVMNKNGGYTWMQTCATVVVNSKNADEQSIICVNYVISGKENTNVIMDCCQLEQDCPPPAVKKEVLVDETDRKSPDQDPADGSGHGRDGCGPHNLDTTTPPAARAGPASERSPEIRDSCTGRERRTPHSAVHPRTNASRLSDETSSVLPDSQPISTPDHLERTQSVRSLDSEPMVPPSVVPTPVQGPQKSGRKRKGIDRNSVRQSNSSASSATDNMTPSGSSSAGMLSSGHAHSLSSPCAKRQIIVQQQLTQPQNEVMDGTPGGNSSNSSHGHNGSLTAPVTPGSVGHDSGSISPHHSEPDNSSGDSARWRKINHQPHAWESTGSTSSVKDLEQVMSKHLPGRESDHVSSLGSSGIDFSTDSLLRQQAGPRTGSAIQWVGPGQSGPGLPVSALLRQLCASRESVIRANVQAAAAAAVAAARGSSYYPDMVQNALPTPPGSDNYNESQFMLGSHQKSGSSDFPSLVPYASVPSYDYQPAMTPPSSVSPRDKPPYGDPSSNGYGDPSSLSNTSFRPPQSYLDGGPAQPLPLKPQVYGYHPHSALESHQSYGNPLTDHTQSQFYPPTHTGFHLYHPGKSTPYGDLKNTNWYSTAS